MYVRFILMFAVIVCAQNASAEEKSKASITVLAEQVKASNLMQANQIQPTASVLETQSKSDRIYIFTAAPRETIAEAELLYRPIAEYLSKSTGKKIEFQYTDSWLVYQKRMRDDDFDIVIDGPHFVGWRSSTLGHTPLLKVPQKQVWALITRADNGNIKNVERLAGRKVCAHEPPNFGTLILQTLFTNPARQPFIISIQGWDEAFKGVIDGKCVATILPKGNLTKLDPDQTKSRVLYEHAPFPNLAMTVSTRVDKAMQFVIVNALSSKQGKDVTAAFRKQYAKSEDFVSANAAEYKIAGDILRTEVGYWFQ